MNQKVLDYIAKELETVGIVFEMDCELCLGVAEVESQVVEIMKKKYDLQRLKCDTFRAIEWEYYIFNHEVMSCEEAKEYALRRYLNKKS